MSTRRREIAGAPERTAGETADVIVEMVGETLGASRTISSALVNRELAVAAHAIRMLIAGKHLNAMPVMLIADPLRLEITTVTGERAVGLDENLGCVPGAATAQDWMLHLPAPQPLTPWITEVVANLDHVTIKAPPSEKQTAAHEALRLNEIDVGALRRAAGGTR
jgi:hypothetical protein